MVLAKLLSPKEVGYYVLGLAITAPVIMFSMLQLRGVLVTDAKNINKFEDYFGVRLVGNLLVVLIVIAILISMAGRYDFRVYIIIFIIALNKIIESTSDIAYGLPQKHEHMDLVAKSMILRNIGAVILLAAVVKLTGNLVFGAASIGMWWLLVLFIFDKRNAEKFGRFVPRFHVKSVLSIVWLGLPLGIGAGIMSANSNMTRYFVEAYQGSESLGYFAAMAYVVIGASRATTALGQSTSARLAQYYFSNRKAYVKLIKKILSVAFVLAVGVVLFGRYLGKPFLSIVYKPEYAERQDVFFWLLVAAGAMIIASILGYAAFATRHFKMQLIGAIIVCGVSVLTSWLLIPRYGMKGAAWAMLLTTTTQCLALMVIILLALKEPLVCESNKKRQ